MLAAVDTSPFSNVFCFLFFFSRQLISLCKFQRVQIVNVLNVLTLKRGHWSCRDCVQSTWGSRRHSGAVSPSCSWKRMLTSYLVCNLKKQNKTKLTKTKQLLLDLGMILKWDNLSNEFIYRFREEHTSWRVTIAMEIRQPKSAASSKKYKSRRIFLALVLFICGLSTLAYWFHTSRCLLL